MTEEAYWTVFKILSHLSIIWLRCISVFLKDASALPLSKTHSNTDSYLGVLDTAEASGPKCEILFLTKNRDLFIYFAVLLF